MKRKRVPSDRTLVLGEPDAEGEFPVHAVEDEDAGIPDDSEPVGMIHAHRQSRGAEAFAMHHPDQELCDAVGIKADLGKPVPADLLAPSPEDALGMAQRALRNEEAPAAPPGLAPAGHAERIAGLLVEQGPECTKGFSELLCLDDPEVEARVTMTLRDGSEVVLDSGILREAVSLAKGGTAPKPKPPGGCG